MGVGEKLSETSLRAIQSFIETNLVVRKKKEDTPHIMGSISPQPESARSESARSESAPKNENIARRMASSPPPSAIPKSRLYLMDADMAPAKRSCRNLRNVVAEVEESFSQHMMRYIRENGLKDADVYKRANLDRRLFSKIKNDVDYQPSKVTAIVLALALRMSWDETKDLLGRAGYRLTHSNKRDIIVEFYIEEGNYDLYAINDALLHFDQQLLWE